MGPLGVQETVFIFVLALLIFGPKKLPELGKTIGKAMSEFRRASSELRATFDREMNAIERENESLKDVTRQYALEEHSSYNHDSYYDSGDYGSGSYDHNSADQTSVSASAPQGADDKAGHHQTVAVDEHGTNTAETANGMPERQAAEPAHAPVTEHDPHSVKS